MEQSFDCSFFFTSVLNSRFSLHFITPGQVAVSQTFRYQQADSSIKMKLKKNKTDKHRNVQLADLPIVWAIAPQHSEDSTKPKHTEVARKISEISSFLMKILIPLILGS